MKILVVDDDPIAGEITAAILEDSGHAIVSAENGVDAMSKLDGDSSISLIVCDMNMPLASGIDLFNELRAQGVAIPFILLSGDDTEELRKKTAGIDAFLVKDESLEIELPRAVSELPAFNRKG